MTAVLEKPIRAAEPIHIVDSWALLAEMHELLGMLDQYRERFAALPRGGIEQAVPLAREVVDRLIDFSEHWFDVKLREPMLVQRVSEYHRLAAYFYSLEPKRSLKFWKKPGRNEPSSELANRFLTLFHDLSLGYLAFYTSQLPDRLAARQWVESASVFCVDMRRALRPLLRPVPDETIVGN